MFQENSTDQKFVPPNFGKESFDSDDQDGDDDQMKVKLEPLDFFNEDYEGEMPMTSKHAQNKHVRPYKKMKPGPRRNGKAIIYQLFDKEEGVPSAKCKICSKEFNTLRGKNPITLQF